MTRSEEEMSSISLLAQLAPSTDAPVVLAALRAIKHRLIGHDQNKELFVRLGIVEPLVRILGTDGGVHGAWAEARVEAGIAIGSLAYGGESYILHLLSCNVLPPLTASLDPATSLPKLIVSSLRTMNTMIDTYVAPSATIDPVAAISSALYRPETLQHLRRIIAQDASDSLAQQQIALAASLVAKSCGRYPSSEAAEPRPRRWEGQQQDLVVQAGVLDALARRLVSFNLPNKGNHDQDGKLPPPAPATAKLAPILDAISTIIQGSKLHAIEFLFSPALTAIFPPNEADARAAGKSDGTTSTYLPQLRPSSSSLVQPPQQIITPAAFPPLSSPNHFPPLSASASNHSLSFPALHYHPNHHHQHHHPGDAHSILLNPGVGAGDDSESSAGEDIPLRRRAETADLEEDDRLRAVQYNTQQNDTENSEPDVEVEETSLVNWLITLVRSSAPITRLTAASLLTNLFLMGLAKSVTPILRLLIVPIIVRLLDESDRDGRRIIGPGCTGVGGVDARTWTRWMVEEKAPSVLARLVMESPELQKAAVDAGAVKKLAGVLKKACATPSSATNGVNGDAASSYMDEPPPNNHPEYNHRMRLKEGALRCLANLALVKDEYRKAVIDARVIQTIVSSCLKPLSPKPSPTILSGSPAAAEGNPSSVLIAACSVVRSVSRSVSILRTSLIDAGVALPMLSLLHHESLGVRIAATMCVCNLVLDFSPMRKPIVDAGGIDVLCDLAKSDSPALRLNALWAIKHFIYDSDTGMRRKIFDRLGAEYIMSIISNSDSSACEDDEEMGGTDADLYSGAAGAMEDSIGNLRQSSSMADPEGQDAHIPLHYPPKAVAAVKLLRKRAHALPATLARKERVALQEQGLEFLRNFLCGNEVQSMIDLVFDTIGDNRLLSLLESLLAAPNPPGEIINAVVYILVHLAAGAPRHRQIIIERTELMNSLLKLCDHHMSNVRNGLVWVIITLTWNEDGDEAEGVRQRVGLLRQMGWAERLKDMRKDVELDVRERVKTAEYQLGVGQSGRTESRSL